MALFCRTFLDTGGKAKVAGEFTWFIVEGSLPGFCIMFFPSRGYDNCDAGLVMMLSNPALKAAEVF